MKKSIAMLVCACAVLAGCASMVYVTEKTPPEIKELSSVKTLGVARFKLTLENNHYITMKVGNEEGAGIIGGSYEGVDKVVLIVVPAPEAAGDFYVTRDKLPGIAQAAWVDYLSGNVPYEYKGVAPGFKMETITSADEKGNPVTGHPTVVSLAKTLDPFKDDAAAVTGLAAESGADVVLAGEMTVYADVVKATAKPVTTGMSNISLAPNQYAVKATVTYEWALFDGKSGKRIADSRSNRVKFLNPDQFENHLFPLPVAQVRGKNDLDKFMASPEYEQLFKKSLSSSVIPYLYLFVPHYLGTFQEAKPDQQ
ncbi:MAG: hypothetical protein JXD23_10890 [Spirochaetales bacterium]|nr:hypothetical protein [Spirochaetales bacterium]